MARKEYLFTSESVSEGNSDKIADQIADAIVDAYIEKESDAKINIGVMVTKQKVVISGEVCSKSEIDVEKLIRDLIKDIGYNDSSLGFDYSTCFIENYIQRKPKDKEVHFINGQKLVFGFAIGDSDAYMPLTITLAHTLMRKIDQLRKNKQLDFLLPDAKCLVTLQYDGKGKPRKVDSIIISAQHKESYPVKDVREAIIEELIKKTIPNSLLDKTSQIIVNSGGDFINGGPAFEVGMSGRKSIIDTYGSWCRCNDETFSGKDPLKVERAGSYMLRKIAKNIVAAGTASKIEIQAIYSSGMPEPISIYIDSFGTGKISDDKIGKRIIESFNLNPESIVKELELLKPKYRKTSCYGHFGKHEESFTWEMIDKVDEFK